MFKIHHIILAQEMELRFQVDGTPEKNTLLALKLNPSVNTISKDGIFSSHTAAYQLMMCEYRRRLVRRHKLMLVSSVSDSSHASLPAKLGMPSMTGVCKERVSNRSPFFFSQLNPDEHLGKAVSIDPDNSPTRTNQTR